MRGTTRRGWLRTAIGVVAGLSTGSAAWAGGVRSAVAARSGTEPGVFEHRDTVRWEEVVEALDEVAFELEQAPAVRADYEAFIERHGLRDTDALFGDYVRLKLAFEATRDGGWWHLRWTITNRKPNSDAVWEQWRSLELAPGDEPDVTAQAECDELSALFAVVARGLGVRKIGLFWPVWNHVVAVWTIEQSGADPVRIVVPTSQIMLGPEESLGTDGFDPWRQRTIYTYRRKDVSPSERLPATLARFMVEQARRHGQHAQADLQQMRNDRSNRFDGS